jgi:hypothetical protein
MKRVILLWAAIWLFGNCNTKLDTTCSVFMQPAKDKRSLLKMGFVHPAAKTLDSIALAIPPGAMENISQSQEKWNDNLLTKRINDTDVLYTFGKEDLIGVQIQVNHVDPTKLLNLLDTLGFERIGVARGPRQVFVNKQANIRYEMFFSADQAIFTDRILGNDGTGKPQ